MLSGSGRDSPVHSLVDLALTLHEQTNVERTATATIAALPSLMAGAVGSIVLSHRHRPVPLSAGCAALERADRRQVELNEGPAVSILRGDSAVLAPDLARDSPWPRWGRDAAAEGWRSWLSLQLLSRNGNTLGVLSVASPRPEAFDRDATWLAGLVATHAAVALDAARIRDNLQVAGDAQARIGHALGILMERYGMDDEQAFSVLRRYSQDSGRKLRDIAADLVQTRQFPEPTSAHRSGWASFETGSGGTGMGTATP
ncbi:ANTAR domain protein with unknown sensor [Kribbella flavida DSM 17836]|uniref:ANTAR domain-containing protein n=1 Tax=Kribbella flavida (strain DSM 17836 / JCM 10339 / NBRC 14399) TaxID=479435 RepID=D2PQA5_KRIFD|nr:GAF and ANTAR domain-containing protein [Kribbella flavida]ADB34807.1 ANTAR domain protein with unknown sensor [Kribbella flavida DSM 17836]